MLGVIEKQQPLILPEVQLMAALCWVIILRCHPAVLTHRLACCMGEIQEIKLTGWSLYLFFEHAHSFIKIFYTSFTYNWKRNMKVKAYLIIDKNDLVSNPLLHQANGKLSKMHVLKSKHAIQVSSYSNRKLCKYCIQGQKLFNSEAFAA